MRVRLRVWSVALVAGASLLAAPSAEAIRRISRDFPHSVLCPVNQGWLVDSNGNPVPPQTVDDASVRFRTDLGFTAQAHGALIRIEACDRSSALGSSAASTDGDALQMGIEDFAVVRKDFWQQHHVARPGPIGTGDCYQDGFGTNTQSVGSVFDRASTSAFSCEMPFADNFDSPATTQGRWVLEGAELSNGEMLLANAIDGGGNDNGRFQCSSATFRVGYLVPGRDYIIDFNWRVTGPGFDGESGEEGFAKVQVFVNPLAAPVLGPRPIPPGARKGPCP